MLGLRAICESPAGPGTGSGGGLYTKIQFQESATPGVTYGHYDSPIDLPTNRGERKAFASQSIAGGIVTAELWPLAIVDAGKRRVIVEAILGAIGDGAGRKITIEYDEFGAVIVPRPNVPGFFFKRVSAGRTIEIDYLYDPTEEKGVGHTAQLFLVQDGATVDWNTPTTEQVLPTADSKGMKRGTISGTPASDGFYRYAVRVRTSAGIKSPNEDLMGPQLADNTTLAAPSNRTVSLIG